MNHIIWKHLLGVDDIKEMLKLWEIRASALIRCNPTGSYHAVICPFSRIASQIVGIVDQQGDVG